MKHLFFIAALLVASAAYSQHTYTITGAGDFITIDVDGAYTESYYNENLQVEVLIASNKMYLYTKDVRRRLIQTMYFAKDLVTIDGVVYTDASMAGAATTALATAPISAAGFASASTDAAGQITISHNLGIVPTSLMVWGEGTVWTPCQPVRTGLSSTTMLVQFFDATGVPLRNQSVSYGWRVNQ